MPRDLPHLERELGHAEHEIWEIGKELARAILDGEAIPSQTRVRFDSLRRHRSRIQFMLGARRR